MVNRIKTRPLAVSEDPIILKFGGGIHSRASEEEIDERESHAGQNFDLDLENRQLRPRGAFDLLTTAPNAQAIRGFVSLLKADGTVTMLYQAGTTVYKWDGTTSTSVGSVSADARLRGRLEANWLLTDVVIVTDLGLAETVKIWDGTTLSAVSFTDENAAAFGAFKAKYCNISNERAIFANSIDPGATTPHLIVGSKRADYTNITVSNRPSSALSDLDPWFLVAPDNKPLNGIISAFKKTVFSTEKGSLWNLTGANATDFDISELYPRSGASGNESMAFVGNDIAYGRQGRIESLIATQNFGDVETDDLSVPIAGDVETFTSWTTVYNSRLQRIYFVPASQNEIWTFHKALGGSKLSPWSKWTTQHASAMQPTAIMNCLDPVDGLEYVYWGDAAGRLFRMEGTGAGDAGANIKTISRSKLFTAPLDAEIYNISGWVKYRKNEAFTITLRFLYAGQRVFNETISIAIAAASGPVWGGNVYWGGDFYWGTAFSQRLNRVPYGVAGRANEFQVEVEVDGTKTFEINEIGLRFQAAS